MADIRVTTDLDGDGNLVEILGPKEQRLKEIVTELNVAIGVVTRAIHVLCDLYAKMGRRPSFQGARPSLQDVGTFGAIEVAMPMQIMRLRRLWGEYDKATSWVGLSEDISVYFPRPAVPTLLAAFMDGQDAATLHRQRHAGDTKWFELADTVFVVAFSLGFRMEATHAIAAWEREARERIEREIDIDEG